MHYGAIPVQSFGSQIRPQPPGLGLSTFLFSPIFDVGDDGRT
jgi:hypothetical protein